MHTPISRGFTLIELLVALGVMAVMALLGWQSLDALLRTRDQVNAATAQSLGWQTALAQWQTDLDSMAHRGDAPDAAPSWSADSGLVRLLRRAPDGNGWIVVAWSMTDGGTRWSRWQSPVVRDREQAAVAWTVAGQRLQAEGVRTVAATGWSVQTWAENGWQDGAGLELPSAVRLRLAPGPDSGWSGAITVDWVSAAVAGGKR